MTDISLADQLDRAIENLLSKPGAVPRAVDPSIRELSGLAAELRLLPSPEFKAQFGAQLQEDMRGKRVSTNRVYTLAPLSKVPRREQGNSPDVLPTLFGKGYGDYPLHGGNLAVSFLMHAAAIALIVASGVWAQRHRANITHELVTILTEPSPYALPAAPTEARGGGGGGDRDKTAASKGNPPRFTREQLTPPMVVVRNERPVLPAEPTVVGPSNITFPQTGQMGDPLSGVLGPPSNGTGSGGGIGSGTGGGVGSGKGPGVGPGWGGGIGGGAYRVGGGVTAPRALYDPDPEYSDEARKAKYQGTVMLWVIVGADGRAKDMRVMRSLGMGLDEKAMEAVRTWRFEPATKDGHPVAVQVSIEVSFRLY